MTETRKRVTKRGLTISISASTLVIGALVLSGIWDIAANLIASWLAPHVGLNP